MKLGSLCSASAPPHPAPQPPHSKTLNNRGAPNVRRPAQGRRTLWPPLAGLGRTLDQNTSFIWFFIEKIEKQLKKYKKITKIKITNLWKFLKSFTSQHALIICYIISLKFHSLSVIIFASAFWIWISYSLNPKWRENSKYIIFFITFTEATGSITVALSLAWR